MMVLLWFHNPEHLDTLQNSMMVLLHFKQGKCSYEIHAPYIVRGKHLINVNASFALWRLIWTLLSIVQMLSPVRVEIKLFLKSMLSYLNG